MKAKFQEFQFVEVDGTVTGYGDLIGWVKSIELSVFLGQPYYHIRVYSEHTETVYVAEKFVRETERIVDHSASYQLIRASLELAFEAGKWAGQVELEEHYDRSQFAEALIESAYSRRNAMPLKDASTGRTVTVNLRSDKWREGVRKSSREQLDKAMDFVVQYRPNI